jgi:hypothetical protein
MAQEITSLTSFTTPLAPPGWRMLPGTEAIQIFRSPSGLTVSVADTVEERRVVVSRSLRWPTRLELEFVVRHFLGEDLAFERGAGPRAGSVGGAALPPPRRRPGDGGAIAGAAGPGRSAQRGGEPAAGPEHHACLHGEGAADDPGRLAPTPVAAGASGVRPGWVPGDRVRGRARPATVGNTERRPPGPATHPGGSPASGPGVFGGQRLPPGAARGGLERPQGARPGVRPGGVTLSLGPPPDLAGRWGLCHHAA